MNDCGLFIRGAELSQDGKTVQNTNLLNGVSFAGRQDSAAPNIKGTLNSPCGNLSGAFYNTSGNLHWLSTRNSSQWLHQGAFNASRSSNIYKDGVTEVRPNNRNYLPIIKLG